MLDERILAAALRDVALGGLRFFETIGSTNDEALAWATSGAPDMSLVIAEEQTSGRGRMGRLWFTPAGSALAFSLVLRPTPAEREHIGRFSGLGALALVSALAKLGIASRVKWPNDVLVRARKVAGILVETVWTGDEIDSLVLGMGVNVLPASLPPAEKLTFPAACIQPETNQPINRERLLADIIAAVIDLRANFLTQAFMDDWQHALAFRGESVQVWQGSAAPMVAELVGLGQDGCMLVRARDGDLHEINFGEVHLRPL